METTLVLTEIAETRPARKTSEKSKVKPQEQSDL
jgi:hypothetical protein